MKLSDLYVNKDYVFEDVACELLRPGNILSSGGSVETDAEGRFLFVTESGRYAFRPLDSESFQRAAEFLRRGLPCLAEKESHWQGQRENVFFLRIVFFSSRERLGALNVAIPDALLGRLKKNKAFDALGQDFLLESGSLTYLAYSTADYASKREEETREAWNVSGTAEASDAGTTVETSDAGTTVETSDAGRASEASDAGTASETSDDAGQEMEKKSGANQKTGENVLFLYGRNCVLTVRMIGEGLDAYLLAEKAKFSFQNLPCFQLARGEVCFSSQKELVSQRVQEVLRSTPGYISLWDKYSDKEGEFLFRRARAVGVLPLERNSAVIEGDRIAVGVPRENADALVWLQKDDSIAFSEEVPAYLQDQSLTWGEWKEQEAEKKGASKNKPVQLKILQKKNSILILERRNGESALPEGVASLSILGNQMQIQRREESRKAIRDGKSANPRVGYIIEGIPYREDEKPLTRARYDPLTALVLEKIFRYPPTPTQRRAIDIALNTPDIAIIQGPPGTGKTTVITAILERLNELADKKNGVRGEVLVTSLQHDAVKNIQERLTINSLPTIKFGRSGKESQEADFDFATETWRRENAAKLKEKHIALRESDMELELRRLWNLYIVSPNNRNALAFLRHAAFVNTSDALSEKISQTMRELEIRTREDTDELILTIRRIRANPVSFADDGPENAMRVYEALEGVLSPTGARNEKIFGTLKKAAMSDANAPAPELLDALAQVREELLIDCTPPPFYRRDTPRQDVLRIYEKVKAMAKTPGNEENRILAAYLKELEYNPASVQASLKNYCFVFTSTLQQSESGAIRRAKNVKPREPVEYDTVIVDEAARANPGDLMIPLAQARNRIVLVGDHRQLPHMYDEDIFEELKNSDGVSNESDIQISMFQHLWGTAKKLEEADGVTRTITLDAQYRMRPELGEFISRQFYEEYGENFASPLSAEHFALPASFFPHGVPEFPVQWLNYPKEQGSEERSASKSRFRMCEARGIVGRIERFLEEKERLTQSDPESPYRNLNFGVISFYSAQVQEIRELMKKKSRLKEALERGEVRVGSVDAFQGMEFDIIFLSVVRSGSSFRNIDFDELERDPRSLSPDSPEAKKHTDYVETVGRNNYGFLTSPNRLCVALSRQKRLLFIAGDSAMFSGDAAGRVAARCVPAMYALQKLCREKGAVTECKE